MTLTETDLQALAQVAADAARQAGRYIATARPETVMHKPDIGSPAAQVVTEVDQRSQDIIVGLLTPTLARYDLALLTEETPDDGVRHTKDYFWCVDPLDGTLPFIEATPGYSVSIALVAHDGTPQIGAIVDPVTGTEYLAIRGQGSFRDGQPWPEPTAPRGDTLSIFGDRSFRDHPRRDEFVRELEALGAELGYRAVTVHTNSAAVMNACHVLEHPPACYFKLRKPEAGGGSLWDFAATACLFHEADAPATDIHGQPLDLNRADGTFMNHRGVCYASSEALARKIQALAAGSAPSA
ncbi:MAG: inositol monophosphatase family protein [Myxococcota bacterium]